MTKLLGPFLAFAVFCTLALAVGFQWRQSVLLAIFAAFVQLGLDGAAMRPSHTFEPYYVQIMPNWDAILLDYTIVRNEEDQQIFTAWCEQAWTELPHAWYSVLRNDKDGIIVYRGAAQGFSTKIDSDYEVKKRRSWLSGNQPKISVESFPRALDFFIKQKFDAIQLGLNVSSDWWQKFSSQCASPVETNEEHMFGTVRIVIAQLPYREFDLYWNEIDYKPKSVDKVWLAVREGRKKHGWEEMEKDYSLPSSLQPISLKNKYFRVHHGSI